MQQARMQSVWKNHYDAHIRTLKQVLSHGLILKKCIKLNHKTWLKPFYIDMNTKLRTESRSHF